MLLCPPRTIILCAALLALTAVLLVPAALAQPTDGKAISARSDDYDAVRRAVLDYAEALYLARPALVERSVSPRLTKVGYMRQRDGSYRRATMSYAQLLALAETWNADGQRANPATAPKRITVLDVMDRTAVARLDAQWGVDLFHLAKEEGRWQIVHVLWQSHPPSATPPAPRDRP